MGKRQRTSKARKPIYRTLEFAGEKYKVPIIYPGSSPKVADKIKVADIICMIYETDRYTLEETLKFVGISVSTFYKWAEDLEEIGFSFRRAKAKKYRIYKQRLEQRALTAAEELTRTGTWIKRTVEYEPVLLTEEQLEKVKAGDLEGVKLYTAKIKETTERFKPNAYATMAILYNIKSDTFERNPEPIQEEISIDEIPKLAWLQEGEGSESIEYDDPEDLDELEDLDDDDDLEDYK